MSSKIDVLIQEFAANLRSAIAEEAAAVFSRIAGGGAGSVGNGRSKPGPKPKAASGKRGRRSAEDLDALGSQVIGHLKRNPGQRVEQISAALGVSTKELARPITLLLADKKLSKKGQKRATAYTAR